MSAGSSWQYAVGIRQRQAISTKEQAAYCPLHTANSQQRISCL